MNTPVRSPCCRAYLSAAWIAKAGCVFRCHCFTLRLAPGTAKVIRYYDALPLGFEPVIRSASRGNIRPAMAACAAKIGRMALFSFAISNRCVTMWPLPQAKGGCAPLPVIFARTTTLDVRDSRERVARHPCPACQSGHARTAGPAADGLSLPPACHGRILTGTRKTPQNVPRLQIAKRMTKQPCNCSSLPNPGCALGCELRSSRCGAGGCLSSQRGAAAELRILYSMAHASGASPSRGFRLFWCRGNGVRCAGARLRNSCPPVGSRGRG